MQCLHPFSIKDLSSEDKDATIQVPCGYCAFCLNARRQDWKFRIGQELRVSDSAFFVTLTYDEHTVPVSEDGLMTLDKRDIQLFHKKIRNRCQRSRDKKIKKFRYYLTGEYGPNTQRPHYHGLYFNIPLDVANQIPDIWNNGFVKVGTVEPESIDYVTKYLINEDDRDFEGQQRPFAMMSLKPGIGENYLTNNARIHAENKEFFKKSGKFTQRLPRYYVSKIFSESDREQNNYKNRFRREADYESEYQRLKRLGNEDPDLVMKEQRIQQYERLLKGANKNRKL